MPDRLQILIAEDDTLDAELLVRALRRAGFEFDWERVDSEPAYLEKLHPGLDIIFSDYKMPQFSGLRALELLKARGLDIPFIIMSGTIGEENVASVMKHGATDCLLKDRMARLEETVKEALSQRQQRATATHQAPGEKLHLSHDDLQQHLEESLAREAALKAEVNALLKEQDKPARY